MQGIVLLLHVLGATIWTGGHIILAVLILPQALGQRSVQVLLAFESQFEKLGMPALLVQIATGLTLAYQLIPSLAGWFDFSNPLTHVIWLKLTLLLLTTALALNARFRVVPRLSADTLPVMAWHIIAVTLLAIGFVVAGVSFRTGWLY